MYIEITTIVIAYLLGSISTAILICQIMGLPDPRSEGSRNPGATNVLRIGGKKAAAMTLAGDMLKGLIPVLIGHAIGLSTTALALVGFAAFIGHLYPVFFGFQGGKGVATALGVWLALSWPAGLATIATWLFVAKVLKISSLSALIATLLAPFYIHYFAGINEWTIMSAVLTVLLYWRHRSNIRNLLSGSEGKISGGN